MTIPEIDLTLRELSLEDVDELCTLHGQVIDALPTRGFLTAHNRDWFERLIGEIGFAVGAFHDGRLIAYSSIIAPSEPRQGLERAMAELDIDPATLARGGGTAIHPDYRGHRIFHPLQEIRLRTARDRQVKYIVGTVFPKNAKGLGAQLRRGHWVVGVHIDGDGENFLTLCRTGPQLPRFCEPGHDVDVGDPVPLLEVLRRGNQLGMPVQTDDGPAIRLATWEFARQVLAIEG